VEVPKANAPPRGASAFLKGGDSDSDDDDDKKRVVRSHREKKWEQMQEAVNELKGYIKQADWVRIARHLLPLNIATVCRPAISF
jgi:translation initiation factor 3 subunit C